MNQEIRLLSGGNQQKIVIAKWLNSNPKIFMFDEPTAGVDIVAKGEIISIIREFADKGLRSNFASSELAEMMAICDDIITILMEKDHRKNRPQRTYERGGTATCNPEEIIKNTDEQIYGVYRSGSCICILRNYIKR